VSDVLVPPARTALSDGNNAASRPYYVFYSAVATGINSLSSALDDVRASIPAESQFSPVANVVGGFSILTQGTLKTGIVRVLLEGDVDQASALSFYGALDAGSKGWQAFSVNFKNTSGTLDLADVTNSGAGSLLAITVDGKGRVTGTRNATITGTAGRVTVANGSAAAGVPTIDLATVSDAGGGSLQRTAFDSYGRKTGTSAATTDHLTEGSTNLYFTDSRVRATVLTGLSTATAIAVTASDSVLVGIGKLQGQASANATSISGKEPAITAGTTAQYWRGDKSWQTLNKAAVGLSNVDNTSDAGKPVSTAQAAAIALKQDVSGLGTAAFVNTGNNASGLIPTLDSPGTGQTSLTIVGPSARANFYLQSGNADGANIGEGTVSFAGTGSVSGGSEKRLALMYVNTDGTTANQRGGKFGINLKQNGSTSLVSRLNVGYLGHVEPGVDNVQTMGSSSLRWSVMYAGTGTINTSDAREKTEVTPLTAAELAAAAALSRAIGTYQWLTAVQAKGADARMHAGLTVQHAIEIMQAHGLDPMSYGFICYDRWDELPEVSEPETGTITQTFRPAGDRYSFRQDELLLFMARGFAARLDALEAA
jgi:hypothetical protein